MLLTITDYRFPFLVPGTYFNPARVALTPDYAVYITDYHVHFLRYIYYMCHLDAKGDYPTEMNYDELINKLKNKRPCKPKIKKILFAEAPNVPATYFYNSTLPFLAANPFTSPVSNCLFPGIVFVNQVDFLIACARAGFILLDLFPYAIAGGYTATNTNIYRNACKSAFLEFLMLIQIIS